MDFPPEIAGKAKPDCVFVIGDKEIEAHKLVLTYNSPVFEKMFHGRMASDRIVITDIDLENFRQMLHFVYTDKVNIKSVLHAWSLFYIAHKYLLSDFADVCTSYIQRNLNLNNLVLNYEYAEMYGVRELMESCMAEIGLYVKGVLLYSDYHMKPSTLSAILEQRFLNISDCDLVKGIVTWAVTECDMNSISLEPQNVVDLLTSAGLIEHCTPVDFTTGDLMEETCQLVQRINPRKKYLQKHWCTFCHSRQTYKISGRVVLREIDALISNVSVNRNVLLFGLVVVSEVEQVGSQPNEYFGYITIEVNEMGDTNCLSRTTCSKIFSYETPHYIPLSELVYLDYDKVYTIRISYNNCNNTGDNGPCKSSVVCNYMSNKLVDDKSKTVFSFDELDGSVVKGVCYFPL